jgi:hypothetical protein
MRGRFGQGLQHWIWLALPALLLAAIGVASQSARSAGARALDPCGTLCIINPTVLKGPAGTNVTVQLSGASANQTYNIVYEQDSLGCLGSGASAPTIPQQTTDSTGAVQFSFPWPADSGTGKFVLCAQAQTTPPPMVIPSQNTFTVLSTTAPAITIQPAPTPTPTGTISAGASTTPQDGYATGESVIVHGTGFLPGGTTVQIALASTPDGDGTVISQGTVNADRNGKFDTTVTLDSNRIGNLYLQAETTDAAANQPPSLIAAAPITISLPPTATPTPTPTVTPTISATATPGGSGPSNTDGTLRLLSIAGLGSFSLLLLLVGTALLISAGSSRGGMS